PAGPIVDILRVALTPAEGIKPNAFTLTWVPSTFERYALLCQDLPPGLVARLGEPARTLCESVRQRLPQTLGDLGSSRPGPAMLGTVTVVVAKQTQELICLERSGRLVVASTSHDARRPI